MAKHSKKQHAGRTTTVRHGRLPRSSTVRNLFRTVLTMVVVAVLSAGTVAAYAIWDLRNRVQTVDLADEDVTGAKLSQHALDGAINILVVGSDSRVGQSIDDGETGELNDVTMLVRISEDHKRATVVSFPRDLMLPIPSCPGPAGEENYYPASSEQQLNSVLQYGLPCVVETVEALTGADISYAGMIGFDGVINMSNALGGVTVCLAQPIQDPNADLDLPAGEVTLKGYEALQFLRTRHGVGDGSDLGRISNQQVFLSAMARQLQSASTLTDPVKVYQLAKAAVENMTLSRNIASVDFLRGLAKTLSEVDLGNVNFVQYPALPHPYQEGRLTPDTYNGELLMQRILNDEDFTITDQGVAAVDVAEVEGEQAADNEGGSAAGEAAPDAAAQPEAAEGATEEFGGDEADNLNQQQANPSNVTGLNAAKPTCAAGRVNY
ncbi:LCP family protein [Canibacter zhoujuaniae]|uniref:LCP family protein n=1 Tax=Canibacter zhoujuaniae TaxID=2708343 RepID=UPI001FB88558|nr:LCP family protein [Canibacter zhoujuaniae]